MLLLAGCRAPAAGGASAGPAAQEAEKFGILAPLDAEPLELWPEAYAGSWTVLTILPHGAAVAEGDVVARCETRAIDEELHRTELELRSAEIAHAGLLARGQLETEGARAALERARAGLERARRALEGWKQQELAFASRADGLSKRWEEAGVEDQTDELDQLEKMYAADELVDATEDIVLKRSRRALSITQEQNALARDRAIYKKELELALQTEQREEDVRAQEENVARLERQHALDARSRADAEARSTDALALQQEKLARLRRDRALFELTAPRAGVLLHGGSEDYRPGKTPPRHRRGSALAPHAELFLVAAAEPMGAAFDVAEGELASFQDGARVEVRAPGGEARTGGTVSLDEHARSLSVEEARFEGFVALEQPLPGARYGQRVRITPPSKPSPSKP
jgi:hypothetical protein